MKLESTVTTLTKVSEAKEKMMKEAKEFGMDSADITNDETFVQTLALAISQTFDLKGE